MGLKYGRIRDYLSRSDVVDERWGLDRIKLYFLPFELFNRLFAFGLNHSADDFITRLTDADAHFPLKLRVKKAVEILRDHVFRYERRVVSKSDIGFSRQRPVNKILIGTLLSVFWIFVQMRRIIGTKQFSVAQKYKAPLSCLNGVRNITPCFGFFLQPDNQISSSGPKRFNLDAWILGFERFDHFLVRVAGQRRVPDYFTFGLCSSIKNLFAIRPTVARKIRDGRWLPRLRPCL